MNDKVKPELQEHFQQYKHNWLRRTDTEEERLFDKRTPGLFKEEFQGDGIICSCSKKKIRRPSWYGLYFGKNKTSVNTKRQWNRVRVNVRHVTVIADDHNRQSIVERFNQTLESTIAKHQSSRKDMLTTLVDKSTM